jgi:HB1, ASXL, restriction endonuclease HTH domain
LVSVVIAHADEVLSLLTTVVMLARPADHQPKEDTMNTKQAIEHVLTGRRKPMRVPAIIAEAVPVSSLKGKTPGQTVYSVLYAEAKKPDGLVVQTGRGTFKLNPKRKRA